MPKKGEEPETRALHRAYQALRSKLVSDLKDYKGFKMAFMKMLMSTPQYVIFNTQNGLKAIDRRPAFVENLKAMEFRIQLIESALQKRVETARIPTKATKI